MRLVLALLIAVAGQAADVVTAMKTDGNTLRFTLTDGGAEIEFVNAYTFRFCRRFGSEVEPAAALSNELVPIKIEAFGAARRIKTSALTIELDPATFRLRVLDPQRRLDLTEWETTRRGALQRDLLPGERIYGIGPRSDGRLDARGQKIRGLAGALYLSNKGYGVYTAGGPHEFDLTTGLAVNFAPGTEIEYVFYLGPKLKDVLERHLTLAPQGWILFRHHANALTRMQKPAYAPEVPLTVPDLLHASLAGNLIPAADCFKHFEPWCVYLPLIVADADQAGEARRRLEPFLLAYFQEAKDRGYPVLRPLPLQYPNDAEISQTADAFMLGDELLVAPLALAANRRRVTLPRGQWTDLRTNTRHAGRQTIEVEGPASSPPVFAKNGTIVPMRASEQLYELHYFPTLAGEFFIYEVERNEWTQVHAAPNGDYMRMEIESKVARQYEWIIHHVKRPLEVDSRAPVDWRYDDKLGNLHLKLQAAAGGDEIINIRLPE